MKREPAAVYGRIGQGVFMSLICLFIYWQVGGYDPVDLTNMAGFMFFNTTIAFMGNYFAVILGF